MNILSRCRNLTIACAITFASSFSLSAAEINAPPTGPLWSDNPSNFFLLGGWGGERLKLMQEGVSFQFSLTNEPAHNLTGGDRSATTNSGQVAFGATLDLEKLLRWKGALFQITYTSRYGDPLEEKTNLGDDELVQEVYGRGQTWWLTQFWLQQAFWDNRLSIRLGKMPINTDFGFNECTFLNLTFCSSIVGNMVYMLWLDWPISQYAARIKLQTSKDTYVQLGAYQVNPNYASSDWARHHGWGLDSPSGTLGALFPLEFGWTPKVNDLPGSYKLGLYYTNAGGTDLYLNQEREPLAVDGGDPLHRRAAYGGYLAFKQQLTGTPDGQGAAVFINIGRSDRYTAQIDSQYTIGFLYHGIGSRKNDGIGFALGATHNSSYYANYARLFNKVHPATPIIYGSGFERTAELYYQWAPLPSIIIRPDLQYIDDPSGSRAYHNALVIGLKSIVNF